MYSVFIIVFYVRCVVEVSSDVRIGHRKIDNKEYMYRVPRVNFNYTTFNYKITALNTHREL